jgi:uncharacterized protein DUF3455
MKRRAALIRTGGCASVIAILAACATKDVAPSSGIPEGLRVPDNQVVSLALRGAGVQIYECQASKDDPTGFAWILKAPDADLSDRAGKIVGRHTAGPTWQANDGSKVTGEIVARDAAPDAGAIPWLLLRATSNTGRGVFGKTRSIQRLHTVGGKAPASACDGAHQGTRARVAYSADYYFYDARS